MLMINMYHNDKAKEVVVREHYLGNESYLKKIHLIQSCLMGVNLATAEVLVCGTAKKKFVHLVPLKNLLNKDCSCFDVDLVPERYLVRFNGSSKLCSEFSNKFDLFVFELCRVFTDGYLTYAKIRISLDKFKSIISESCATPNYCGGFGCTHKNSDEKALFCFKEYKDIEIDGEYIFLTVSLSNLENYMEG